MNRFEGSGNREAKIRYLDADFQILSAGNHVVCAISGKPILVDELIRLYQGLRQGSPGQCPRQSSRARAATLSCSSPRLARLGLISSQPRPMLSRLNRGSR